MGNWTLLADFDGLETLIKIGLALLFMIGPYLLQLLGGKAVQNDRGNAREKRRREPQSELEREIAEFLQQSQGGSSSTVPAQSAPTHSAEYDHADDFVAAEPAHESLRDHHLTSSIGDPQDEEVVASRGFQHQEATELSGIDVPDSLDEYRYEDNQAYNYDTDNQTAGADASAEIAAMFRDPGKVRNAFILGEIINRPKFPREGMR